MCHSLVLVVCKLEPKAEELEGAWLVNVSNLWLLSYFAVIDFRLCLNNGDGLQNFVASPKLFVT